MEMQFDAQRAFGGIDRLFGESAAAYLAQASVTIVGVGGVGSWAVEALARSGVGALRLIDMDHLAESNLNRQLPALISTLGRAKIEVLAARIADINPACRVTCIDSFVELENIPKLLTSGATHLVIDCIDVPRVKAAMIAHCQSQGLAIVVCGGAGGKCASTKLGINDLSAVTHDPLLSRVRSELRRRYAFAKIGKMRVRCVSSDEPRVGASAVGGLACAGYGSVVTVTATMGFMAADAGLQILLQQRDHAKR